MSCEKIEARLVDDGQAFLDREVRDHLKGCPAFSKLYDELEEIEKLHRELARREKAPLDFTGRVISQIPTGFRRKFPLIAAGLILAVAAAMAGIGSSPDLPSTDFVTSRIEPTSTRTTYPALHQAQPVELDLSYPRVQLYMIPPLATLKPENNFRIEIIPADPTQTDYLKYISH